MAERSPAPVSIFHEINQERDSDGHSHLSTEEIPAILPNAPVGPEYQGYLPLSHQAQTTLRDGLWTTPFANSTVDPNCREQRQPMERSSSLEVHAWSPNSLENDSGDSPVLVPRHEGCENITDFGNDGAASPVREEQTLHETTSNSDSFQIVTRQISHSKTSSSWACLSSHLATQEETFDGHVPQPRPRQGPLIPALQSAPPGYGGPRASAYSQTYSTAKYSNYAGEVLRPKYPPCWTTGDGLLIVPSVPGEFPWRRPIATTKNEYSSCPKQNDNANDQFSVVPLSPNVTEYRKGRYPRRKR